MAAAMDWVSRILAVSVEMLLPGLLGQWLDRRWGTEFLVVVGFGLGLVLGTAHLLAMVRSANGGGGRKAGKSNADAPGSSDSS